MSEYILPDPQEYEEMDKCIRKIAKVNFPITRPLFATLMSYLYNSNFGISVNYFVESKNPKIQKFVSEYPILQIGMFQNGGKDFCIEKWPQNYCDILQKYRKKIVNVENLVINGKTDIQHNLAIFQLIPHLQKIQRIAINVKFYTVSQLEYYVSQIVKIPMRHLQMMKLRFHDVNSVFPWSDQTIHEKRNVFIELLPFFDVAQFVLKVGNYKFSKTDIEDYWTEYYDDDDDGCDSEGYPRFSDDEYEHN